MLTRLLAVSVTLIALVGPVARAQENLPPLKLDREFRLLFEAEWQKRQLQFTETLKKLNLDPDTKVSAGPPAIGASITQVVVGFSSQVQMHVVVPVKRARIRTIKSSAQDGFPNSPSWPCPFGTVQQMPQCGQIPPVNAIHPGGIGFLPYTVIDLDDGTTMVETVVFNWVGAPYARNARVEIDYLLP
jgi:hypothetical protein